MSAKAKLFRHGRSQAVRLPKEFRLPGNEVLVSAYCGPGRNLPTFVGERGITCGIEANAANTPLVAICVAMTQQ